MALMARLGLALLLVAVVAAATLEMPPTAWAQPPADSPGVPHPVEPPSGFDAVVQLDGDDSDDSLLDAGEGEVVLPFEVQEGFDVTEGLAPDLLPEEIEGHELGSDPLDLSAAGLLDDDGVFEWLDGDETMSLRQLPAGEAAAVAFSGSDPVADSVAATTALQDLAASAAVSYVPAHDGLSNETSAVVQKQADNWFVSDTGQLFLPVGGVLILFDSGINAAAVDAIWSQFEIAPGRVSAVEGLPNAFKIDTSSDVESLQLVRLLSQAPGVESVTPNMFTLDVIDAFESVPTTNDWQTNNAIQQCKSDSPPFSDALSACLWHLEASKANSVSSGGQTYQPLADINIDDVWDITKGAGVTVSIVDKTWEAGHEDLVGNSNRAASTYWNRRTGENGFAGPWHGTTVAGIIGARDNTIGGRGVAPRASLLNVNYIDSQSLQNAQQAFLHRANTVAVSNHSYGKRDSGRLERWSTVVASALERSLESGFGGKGTVHVKSVGNGKDDGVGDEASLEESNNHYGLIVACAVNSAGTDAAYSEEGSTLWVCGPSGDIPRHTMLAPFGKNHYRIGLRGTSFSAPVVSGVVALVRSANTALTWRDVKLILANTAQKNDSSDSSWQSGALQYGSTTDSYSYSRKYGFGLVDASAAVTAARSWTNLPPMISTSSSTKGPWEITKADRVKEFPITLNSDVSFVEHVDVNINMNTSHFRTLKLTLISPSGKESLLVDSSLARKAYCGCRLNGSFKLGSVRHLGESATGTWKLRVENVTYQGVSNYGHSAKLNSWGITVYGHNPSRTEVLSLTTTGGSYEGNNFTVTVNHQGTPLASDLVVPIVLTSDEATPPGQTYPDYTALTSITIPAGTSRASATVSTIEDNIHELDEYLTVKIGALQAPYTSDGIARKVIIIDDDKPKVTIKASKNHYYEGERVIFTVTMDRDPAIPMNVRVIVYERGIDRLDFINNYIPSDVWRWLRFTTAGSQVVSVGTELDKIDEPTRQIVGVLPLPVFVSSDYRVSGSQNARVTISDDLSRVGIESNGNINEGEAASFTLTAFPVPTTPLVVRVSVAETGYYGVDTSTRTVKLDSSGTAKLTIPTVRHGFTQPDGAVTATVEAPADKSYYPIPRQIHYSATATITDLDKTSPTTTPVVIITGGDDIIEGSSATFTLRTLPAPTSDITVNLKVASEGSFDVNASTQTVTVPSSGTATLTIPTQQNGYDGIDGLLTATVIDGASYDVYSKSSASVVVADSNTGAPSSTVSITSHIAITEGGTATFLLTADPAPAAAFDVNVMVQSVGDYGVSTGTRKVTIPVVGLAGLGIATLNDSIVEPHGSVIVALVDGTAYDLDPSASEASVVVSDDDTPFVSVAANGHITEGSDAVFTFTANPLPPTAFDVSVALTVDGDFGVTASTQIVTISVTGSALLTLATTDDAIYKSTGSVTATVVSGSGYYLNSSASTATVYVADKDDPLTPQARAELITDVKSYAAETSQGTDYVNRWKRALLALGEKVPGFTGTPITALQAFDYANQLSRTRWNPVVAALQKIETAKGIRTVPASGVFTTRSNITEGYSATFWLTLSGSSRYSPQANVRITTTGDYGITSGVRTVRLTDFGIGTPIVLATTNDLIDEPNGSVTVEVIDGIGYIPSSSSEATVFIADNDVTKISITADGDITEGDSASFTFKASPVPSADLDVTVNVSVSGDYGVTAGSQTVTIPTSGTATLTLATTGDSVDEADGSVTVALAAGQGYTLNSAASSATVTVTDDDGLPVSPSQSLTPEVSIAAGSAVTEGSNASFTFTANPAPASALDVSVNITASGSYGVTTGNRTVTIPASGTATLTVATTGDSTVEADGSVTATLVDGAAYDLDSSASAATVNIADDDIPEVSVTAGSDVTEGGSALFTLSASPAPLSWLDVSVTVSASGDFGVTTGSQTVTIPASGTATLTVVTTGDSIDEADGSVTVTLVDGADYDLDSSASAATVNISDDDTSSVYVVPAKLVADVRGYAAETDNGVAHVNRWRRVLLAFGESVPGFTGTPVTVTEAQGFANQFWSVRWDPVVIALQALAANSQTPSVPEVSITAGSDVIEGSSASFSLTANPAPSANLDVTVTVTASGSYGVTTGSRTVSIGTSGTAKLTVVTTGDSIDEINGSATVTLVDGANYDLDSTASAATVNISDDDVPEVSITAGNDITEGSNASFTLTADPSPHTSITVNVALTASGDFGVTTGNQTVTIGTSGTATLTVATTGDTVDEVDGSVTVTVNTGNGYSIDSSASAATVNITDDDASSVYVVPAKLVSDVKGYAAETENGVAHVTRWKRVLLAFGESVPGFSGIPMTLIEAQGFAVQFWSVRWDPVVAALQTLAAASTPAATTPEISIAAGSNITEGSSASFTLTANPAPSANLDVTVTVTASGSYGVTTGSRTVTIGTSGRATLTVATSGDSINEADGSVTATLVDGAAYNLDSSASAATVNISDDDDPIVLPPPTPATPVVGVTAGNGITEGGTASFTLTANPAPSANLDVTVTVSATGVYGVTTGSRTVTIATSGTATLTVATTGDSTDETDGSVTATLVDGAAYDLDSSASSATVAISDDDAPVPPPASVPPADAITVSVDEVVYVEGQSLIYVINFRLSKPASKLVTVKYTTGVLGSGAGYATEGEDFMWHSGFISFSPGDTEATGWILAFDDSVKEPDETFTIVLSEPTGGVHISDKQPVLTIKDND